MKVKRHALMGILVVTSMLACSKDATKVRVDRSHPLAAEVEALGFRSDMIRDMGDYLLIEGDIRIPKWYVQRADTFRPQLQWTTDSLVGSSQIQDITVDLSGLASQPAWQTAARQALTAWNKVNCTALRLRESSPGDITINTFSDPFDPGLAAVASFPLDASEGSGKPGPTIDVNTAYTGSPNNSSTKLRNMVHEIGHTIGFRHTNWQALNEDDLADHEEYGANQVPGTPATDAASVMNGNTATTGWGGFSGYDTVATKVRYPGGGCVQPISGSATMTVGNTCYYYASASGGTAPYIYTWSYQLFDGASAGGGSSSNGQFLLAAQSEYGSVKLMVDVTDALGPIGGATKWITISPMGPSCSY